MSCLLNNCAVQMQCRLLLLLLHGTLFFSFSVFGGGPMGVWIVLAGMGMLAHTVVKYEQMFGHFVVIEDSGVSLLYDVLRIQADFTQPVSRYAYSNSILAYAVSLRHCNEKQTDPKTLHNSCN